jgi:hypothetical protein
MVEFRNSSHAAPWIVRLATGVAVLMALVPTAAHAQDRAGRTIMCASRDGQRAFCDADTHAGVRLVRQVSTARCEEGSTWGFNERGIWVDRNCGAEFLVSGAAAQELYPAGSDPRARIEAGTIATIRTGETIDVDRSDGRVFAGEVDEDVRGETGRVAIPRGSRVELMVKEAPDRDLILDLESVTVNGQRYAIDANTDRVEAPDGLGKNQRTGEYVGGGALLGTIIGAIAGGGKGAAIGAVAGAAAGAGGQAITRGRAVRIPRGSLLTFRLDRALVIGVADRGATRDGNHYHDYRRRTP